jgi:ATP-dependent Clp protease ATP-binding subunit ClpC
VADRMEKFNERARRVLTLTQEEAQRFDHLYLGTEHLLVGLVREGQSATTPVLAKFDLDVDRVRKAVKQVVGRGTRPMLGISTISLTPSLNHVIDQASEEANKLNHQYVGPEHLLLAFLTKPEGNGAEVLKILNIDSEELAQQVREAL